MMFPQSLWGLWLGVYFMTGGMAEKPAPLMVARKQEERQRRRDRAPIFPSRACPHSDLTFFQ